MDTKQAPLKPGSRDLALGLLAAAAGALLLVIGVAAGSGDPYGPSLSTTPLVQGGAVVLLIGVGLLVAGAVKRLMTPR